MDVLRAIIRGCGYVDGYGSHPGTGVFMVFMLFGGLAGAQQGMIPALVGVGAMFVAFGPLYFAGAYSRGKDWTRGGDKP